MPSTDFKVSVITPVYNAEAYLRKAVDSAVHLDEVGEIILIEDQSPDNALDLAMQLARQYDKVKVFQHADKQNHGAGASRNLGIEQASFDYIAFLDADDYYLPDRFLKDKERFKSIEHCDGVYNSVGTHFYSDTAKAHFFENGYGYQEYLTLTDTVAPSELFSVLFSQHPKVSGQFCTDGITVKKSVFERVGFFNTQLRLRQDIHLWRRLAGFCNLYSGELSKPVAMRGIHESNRMTKIEDHEQYMDRWWESLRTQFTKQKLEHIKLNIFEQAYYNYYAGNSNKLIAIKALISNAINDPSIMKDSNGHFDRNVWKVFGRNWITLRFISFKNKILS